MDNTPRSGRGECLVRWSIATGAAHTWGHMLSNAEQARIATLRQTADQDRFVAGRALLRSVAADLLGTTPPRVVLGASCPDCPRPHGKPTLPGTGWDASISHSGQLVAVALSSVGPVGIDVECVDETVQLHEMESQMLSQAEREMYCSSSARSFFRTWTRKEAVLKATGDGLRVPMSGLSVSPPHTAPRLMSFADRPELVDRIRLTDLFPAPDYAASLAVIPEGEFQNAEYDISTQLAFAAE
ncbi:4'-phosphopantetheinyl transferase family protein [Streptomyces sp. NPDC050256]|uniref:4'-phosphopantetheinyl transferase family protein n=1 Tax=unclassified Streptomyces TaxID=2593676 RepID=UPI00379F8BE6